MTNRDIIDLNQPAIPALCVPCPGCLAGVDQFCLDRDGEIQAALCDVRRKFARDPDVVWMLTDGLWDAFGGGEL